MTPRNIYKSPQEGPINPGGPVVNIRNLPSKAGVTGLIPGLGTKILHASGHQSPHAATIEHVCPRAHDQKPDEVTAVRSLRTATRESPCVASKINKIKKNSIHRIDAFELWCWRRFLRVPWTARRSNQSILQEFNPEYSLEGLMLKLRLQYFGHVM